MDTSRIGPFAIEQRLGHDEKSAVFRAIHVEQGKPVALRLFSAPLVISSAAARQEFFDEFDALKRLRHRNIVRCYGGGFEKMQGYIASEFVHGDSLQDLLDRRTRLPWEMVVQYAMEIATGLEQAHDVKIAHQDLRPDKILLAENGSIKIADFRKDRRATAKYQPSLDRTPEKFAYKAPELFLRDTTVTRKVDLYSLGCIMFHMLTGRAPFQASSAEEMIRQHQETPPDRVGSIVLDCPIWLDGLVSQLLEKDPRKRPHSARSIILALQETRKKVAEGVGVAEHAVSGFSPLKTGVNKEEARKLLGRNRKKHEDDTPFYEQAWFLALCLFLLVGGITAWVLWPVSERSLITKGERLLASDNSVDARAVFARLLDKFPDSEYALTAQDQIDRIDMDRAEARLRVKAKLGTEPSSEGERLYAEAWNYEQFGDRVTALERYEGIVNLLDDSTDDRPYVKLARRQMRALEDEAGSLDIVRFLQEKLDEADELVESGHAIGARKIWRSIISLYADKREYAAFVDQADARLSGKPVSSQPGKEAADEEAEAVTVTADEPRLEAEELK